MASRVQSEPFDISAEIAALTDDRRDIGAVASFIGLVRERTTADGPTNVVALELEHYPGMTERALEQIEAEAATRWPLSGTTIVHRVGKLALGAPIVLTLAASAHRGAAFEAAEFLMDFLKTRAPFWKREHRSDGATAWVDARTSDDAAAARWSSSRDV